MEYDGIPARKHVPVVRHVIKSIQGVVSIIRGMKHNEHAI